MSKKMRIKEVVCNIPNCDRSFKTVKGYKIHYTKKHLINWGYVGYPTIIGETVNE